MISDNKLKFIIEKLLKRDPIISDESIHVDVEKGIATFKGYVKTELEKHIVIENAIQAGTKDVNVEFLIVG